MDLVGSSQTATIQIMGNVDGSLLSGLFGNVTVLGSFRGFIGDGATVPGAGNVLWVVLTDGGLVTPPNAFTTYVGYP